MQGPGLTLQQRSAFQPGVSSPLAKATRTHSPTQPASGAAAGAAQAASAAQTAGATQQQQQQRTGGPAEAGPAGPANAVEAAASAAVAFMEPSQEQDIDMEREGSGSGRAHVSMRGLCYSLVLHQQCMTRLRWSYFGAMLLPKIVLALPVLYRDCAQQYCYSTTRKRVTVARTVFSQQLWVQATHSSSTLSDH